MKKIKLRVAAASQQFVEETSNKIKCSNCQLPFQNML